MAENGDPRPVQDAPAAVKAAPVEAGAPGTAQEAAQEAAQETAQKAGQDKNTWKTIGIILGVLVFVIAISALFYGLMTHPVFTAGLRDIAIILLALVTMITSILLAILLFQLQSLIVLLRDEIQPILESINQTTSTVRGTTTFVSDAVVTPVIQVAGYVSGVRTAFKTLFGGSGGQGATPQTVGRESAVASSEPAGPAQEPGEPS